MATFTALYDSCVFYPAALRDLLMELALTDLYRAKWTDKIHDEWTSSLINKNPKVTKEKLDKTRELINLYARDALITDYEDFIGAISLPDPNDRHVLAAAIHGRADVIVTYNLKDFPKENLSMHNIEAQHPDDFLIHLLDLASPQVCTSIKTVRSRLKSPTLSADEYINILEQKHKLPKFCSGLRAFKELV